MRNKEIVPNGLPIKQGGLSEILENIKNQEDTLFHGTFSGDFVVLHARWSEKRLNEGRRYNADLTDPISDRVLNFYGLVGFWHDCGDSHYHENCSDEAKLVEDSIALIPRFQDVTREDFLSLITDAVREYGHAGFIYGQFGEGLFHVQVTRATQEKINDKISETTVENAYPILRDNQRSFKIEGYEKPGNNVSGQIFSATGQLSS